MPESILRLAASLLLATSLAGCASGEGLCVFPQWRAEKVPVASSDLDSIGVSERFSAPLVIGPQNTQISFVGSSDTASHEGQFTKFSGSIELPADDLTRATLSVDLEMNSITSRTLMLAWYLKGKNAFDVETYPKASFRSTKIEKVEGQKHTHFVTGEFSIHGRRRLVGFPATFSLASDSLDFTAEIMLHQSDFGLDRLASKTKNDVPVTVAARLPRNDGLIVKKPAGEALRTATAKPQ